MAGIGGVGLPLLLLLTLFCDGGEGSFFYVRLADAADLRGGDPAPFLHGTIARGPAGEQASCGGHRLLLLLTLLWG